VLEFLSSLEVMCYITRICWVNLKQMFGIPEDLGATRQMWNDFGGEVPFLDGWWHCSRLAAGAAIWGIDCTFYY
jgi:hypothetical protein